ncbi:DNA-binding SARP family transcriptional activator [Cryobacterium sp. CAN_C3]|uniref:BTAD domain-containing putative transcriptional regulator n=1 Tax=unclassified Cryobacterium TaxID=2649013 RepID=UPI0018C8F457|nr:BTAD domain-containing putative transcriptional regulator [Cryobacterium sp. CAN_C3]MEC5152683.1 DNA-binding SARP family transcriptional activator [Cryobacterium sp. CAN_C3]
MKFVINLLGRPVIDCDQVEPYRFRSRKSWALLAFLLLNDRPPSRRHLAAMLFGTAADPLRALRWSIGEIRHALGDHGCIEGDPVVLQLPIGASVDVTTLTKGAWGEAMLLPGLGSELLEGATFRDAATFECWLLSERRHLSAATEAIVHEAALGMMSQGNLERAISYAVRLIGMNALDENHQALLIRLYRLAGDDLAVDRQFAACRQLLLAELGVEPGPAVEAALRVAKLQVDGATDAASIEAIIESGLAAVGAGAIDVGVQSLRSGVALADVSSAHRLRVTSRLALAGALIHSLRGQDEEGVATLHAADEVAMAIAEPELAAEARAEIGYVDFLRARYDRAELRLTDARRLGNGSLAIVAKAEMYLGATASDRGNYPQALEHLTTAVDAARAAGETRMEAYALSMLGRIHLLRTDFSVAERCLNLSQELCEQSHWLAFAPWPQSLSGEVDLGRSLLAEASHSLDQAFARACQLGDPCWEGMSARGRALVAEAEGESERAFEILADARIRSNRLTDPYVWLEAYILDAQCDLGRRYGHPNTAAWVGSLGALASRTGMREFVVRSLLHAEALGDDSAGRAARLLGPDIDNPALAALLSR